MSVSDWIVMVLLAPLLIAVLWIILVRVWTAGAEVTAAVSWFTGEGRGLRGYHAGLGPGVLSMTAGWLGYILAKVRDGMGDPPSWLDSSVNVLVLACLGFLLIGLWMWAVQWPKFLIPPQFRDRNASPRRTSTHSR